MTTKQKRKIVALIFMVGFRCKGTRLPSLLRHWEKNDQLYGL